MDATRISYADEKITAEIEVQEANIVAGVRRTRLQQEAQRIAAGQDLDVDEWIACTVLWPDVCACSKGTLRFAIEALAPVPWPVEWATFKQLPNELVMPIVDAVYRVNPHWADNGAPVASTEKKSSLTS